MTKRKVHVMDDPIDELNEIVNRYRDRTVTRGMGASYIRELLAWAAKHNIEIEGVRYETNKDKGMDD